MFRCPLCNLTDDIQQQIILENEHCFFIQKEIEQAILRGSGLIIPKSHRTDVFGLSREEWNATYELLQEVKVLLDRINAPDGYTWVGMWGRLPANILRTHTYT